MKRLLKGILEATPFAVPIQNWASAARAKRDLIAWREAGEPTPPPHAIKQRTLTDLAERHGLRTLVETGTYLGDMVEAMRRRFDKVYSIELSAGLHARARRRFRGARNVELIHGDSAVTLGSVVKRLEGPALFWLDGHYSAGETARGEKDTPIFEELTAILSVPESGHVIVVDDARLFGVDPGYPTVQSLTDFVTSKRSGLEVVVRDDAIQITPRARVTGPVPAETNR